VIEIIVEDRCTNCNACVAVCPTNVLDAGPGIPVIARQLDCQTCFMCELYCPHDAIYVAPDCDRPVAVDAQAIVGSGLLGEFRRLHGWDEWADDPRFSNEHWQMEHVFVRAREMVQTCETDAHVNHSHRPERIVP
jgi:NAD-dependent dihydropyrimidine dehydrogenase PreA subunit